MKHKLKLTCKLSQLMTGVILRDSHGVAQVRHITGNKILRILKAKGEMFSEHHLVSDYKCLFDVRIGPISS